MKKLGACLLIIACCLFFAGLQTLYAQAARVIDVEGKVYVKVKKGRGWEKAKIDMVLENDSEVLTKSNSECTLTLDEELNNIISVHEDSHIQIKNIIPTEIKLPRGRVFSIIENISSIKSFTLTTPTAVAGVRGTGLSIEYERGTTSVNCFEDTVIIRGLDRKGRVTESQELEEGYGLWIKRDGKLGKTTKISAKDYKEWEGFKSKVMSFQGFIQEIPPEDITKQMREEEKESLREEFIQDLREEIEKRDEDIDNTTGGKIVVP